MALSFSQLEQLWFQAGGDPGVAPTMAAIALAESGGDPLALNPNDNHGTQSSFGLWQISNGTHEPPDPNWADPLENARLAVAKYHNPQGLANWGTYTSGVYERYLSATVNPSPSSWWQPSGKAVFSAPVFLPDQTSPHVTQVNAFEALSPPPDVLRAWKNFQHALSTHLPRAINRTVLATRSIRALR